jgi:hypothetical protein
MLVVQARTLQAFTFQACNVLFMVCMYILCIYYSDMNKAHVYTDTSS